MAGDQPRPAPLASEGAHWYDLVTREPRYEVPNQSKPGTMRNATLRDARKHGWGPGQSAICRMLAAPQLTRWLIDQGITAGRSVVQQSDETNEAWMRRAREEADRVGREARERGTELHAAVEAGIAGLPDPDYPHWVDAAKEALLATCGPVKFDAEKVAVSREVGFGTKIDLLSLSGGIILDWKTKDGIDDVELYDNHLMQLAAGGICVEETFGITCHTYAIGFIDRESPQVRILCADEKQIRRGREMFLLCANLWKLVHNYNPGQP